MNLQPIPNYTIYSQLRSRLDKKAFKGNGTQRQWIAVLDALSKAPAEDVSKIGCISVFNYHRVNKWHGVYDGCNTLGFAEHYDGTTIARLRAMGSDAIGAITIAGKIADIEFVTLHELGHIILGPGSSEADADNYARSILNRAEVYN